MPGRVGAGDAQPAKLGLVGGMGSDRPTSQPLPSGLVGRRDHRDIDSSRSNPTRTNMRPTSSLLSPAMAARVLAFGPENGQKPPLSFPNNKINSLLHRDRHNARYTDSI